MVLWMTCMEMAIRWCNHVNGTTIFPKLPVYLRSYHKIWERNWRVKDATNNAKNGLAKLDELNNAFTMHTESAADDINDTTVNVLPQSAYNAKNDQQLFDAKPTNTAATPSPCKYNQCQSKIQCRNDKY